MLIAIISDVHNNLVNLKKVLDYCRKNKIEKIICCGDLASLETLDFLNDNFMGKIYYTFGNMDEDFLRTTKLIPARNASLARNASRNDASGHSVAGGRKYENTKIFKEYGEMEIENRKIAFVHYPRKAKELAETGKYDFVFYGHTHKPWEEIIGNCKMLNPGNVAGEIYPPTFAVWNTENDKFELVRINELKN